MILTRKLARFETCLDSLTKKRTEHGWFEKLHSRGVNLQSERFDGPGSNEVKAVIEASRPQTTCA